VERHLIGDHPHVIVAPRGHQLVGQAGLAVCDLTHEVFLTRESGSGTRGLMERLFASSNLAPTIGMEFDSNESIKQGVMAGLGIAFISAHTVAAELEDGRLVTLDVAGLPVVQQWFVTRRSDKVLLPPAQKAFAFMAQEAARFLPKPPIARRGRRAVAVAEAGSPQTITAVAHGFDF
jgi:LysR family transcriptional regulator for metE and metH